MVDSFNLNLSGAGPSFNGWPILPHGVGAYFSVFRNTTGSTVLSGGNSYGEYMPKAGRITAVAINYFNNTSAEFNYVVANYGGVTSPALRNTSPVLGATEGSDFNDISSTAIAFVAGDYIGIYVSEVVTGTTPPKIVIEGTIYVEFS